MRVMFVRVIGKRKYGGGERWVIHAAASLQTLGHQVAVAGRKGGIFLNEAAERGLETIPFSLNKLNRPIKAITLWRILGKKKTDVIVCMGRELPVVGLAARFQNSIAVVRRASSPPTKKKWKLRIYAKYFTDGIITNTATIREVYKRLGFTNSDFIRLIYNGIMVDDRILAHDFSVGFPGRTIALCVGRVVADKGYFYLIDALQEIVKIFPGIMFFVIGEGKDKKSLISYSRKKNLCDYIHFAGYVHQPVSYYKGCHLFVHPSLYEGLPNAPLEAMAYGKPVIMTRVDGAEELSNSGRNAILIPPADSDALARAVISVLEQNEKMQAMGQASKKFVREHFSHEARMDEVEQFLLQQVGMKKNTKNLEHHGDVNPNN